MLGCNSCVIGTVSSTHNRFYLKKMLCNVFSGLKVGEFDLGWSYRASDGKMRLPEPLTSQPIASPKGLLLEASFSIAH